MIVSASRTKSLTFKQMLQRSGVFIADLGRGRTETYDLLYVSDGAERVVCVGSQGEVEILTEPGRPEDERFVPVSIDEVRVSELSRAAS